VKILQLQISENVTIPTNDLFTTVLVMNDIYNLFEGAASDFQALQGARTWAVFYNQYRVISSHIELSLTTVSPQSVNMVCLPLTESPDLSAVNLSQLSSQKLCKTVQVAGTNGYSKGKIFHNCNVKRLWGTEENTPFYGVTTTGTTVAPLAPLKKAYWILGLQNSSELGNEGIDCNIRVKIKCKVKFNGRRYIQDDIIQPLQFKRSRLQTIPETKTLETKDEDGDTEMKMDEL
jgi:hypothetical protein